MTTSALPLDRRRKWLGVGAWIAVSVAVAIAATATPWQRAFALLGRLDVAWLLVALVLNTLPLLLWAAEWRLLLPDGVRMTYGRMFEVVSVTATVLNTVPFFAGEASAVALLMTRGGLTSGAAASVLALDQLLVGIGKLAVVLFSALVSPLPAWIRAGVVALASAVAGLAFGLMLLAHRWDAAQRRLRAMSGRWAHLLARAISIGEHLDALRNGHRSVRAIALALAKKGAELAAIIAVQLAFGGPPSLAIGLLVLAALSLSTLLPITPANLGVYEATVFGVYRYVGFTSEAALAIAIVQHLCFLVPSIAVGYVTLTLRQLAARSPRAH